MVVENKHECEHIYGIEYEKHEDKVYCLGPHVNGSNASANFKLQFKFNNADQHISESAQTSLW